MVTFFTLMFTAGDGNSNTILLIISLVESSDEYEHMRGRSPPLVTCLNAVKLFRSNKNT